MADAKRVAVFTLGCKINAYDTQAMLEKFLKNGYEYVDFEDEADVYLVNTCAVTNIACKKSRQMIKRAALKNRNALVVAAGCYLGERPDVPGADIVIGPCEKSRVYEIVQAYKQDAGVSNDVSDIDGFEGLSVEGYAGQTRAYVKIQDGCDSFCSYCIVPYIRGPSRSRKKNDCVDECRRLAENGFKEVVLTGVNAASYNRDGDTLIDIIAAVSDIAGIKRIRLSSLDPLIITDTFLDTIKGIPKVCDHFHLSLQSGCDKILRDMNRRYDTAFYEGAVGRIRQIYPNAGLTTDIIAGFPGETQRDFETSINFCEKIKFSKIHVFPFSARKGTAAYNMPGQVPSAEKKQRAREFISLSDRLRQNFLDACAGAVAPVLFESAVNGAYEGHTANYIKVVNQKGLAVNTIADIILKRENMR